jgi:hypothetical protein
VATDASKNLVSVTNTGTGNNVLATSPTLVTPALGTPASGVMTNVTGINYDGYKNRIINGAMVIDQRNAGASVTANNVFSVDRWKAESDTSNKWSAQQNAGSVTPPTGFINYVGGTSSSAYSPISTDYFGFRQSIEGLNIADLGWGSASASTVTLSFWVRSSLTGSFGGSLLNSAQNRCYPFSYTISTANTWEQKTITIAGDTSGTWLTTNGIGIGLFFSLGAGSSRVGTANAWTGTSNVFAPTGSVNVVGTNGATFYITGVQLEKGSTATSFDYRPYGTELVLAQRYYQTYIYPAGNGIFTGTSAVSRCAIGTQVQFRSAPTVTLTGTISCYDGTSTGTITAFTATYSGINMMEFDANTATGTFVVGRIARTYYAGSANGTINGSAEL